MLQENAIRRKKMKFQLNLNKLIQLIIEKKVIV